MAHNEAWERVLAAVAAEAKRAEAMLHGPTVEAGPVHDGLVGVPTEWMLPTTPAGAAILPPLSEMPPVPPELRERIESLRDHIEELQGELSAALGEWRRAGAQGEWRQPRRPVVLVTPAEQPVFVDRRV
jgi:hypothetical protein